MREGGDHAQQESRAAGENSEERLLRTALEYRGKVFTGANHGLAWGVLEEAYTDYVKNEVREGYVTTLRPFVDREEANRIVEKSGQSLAQIAGF